MCWFCNINRPLAGGVVLVCPSVSYCVLVCLLMSMYVYLVAVYLCLLMST
jgi:hypothetical protein